MNPSPAPENRLICPNCQTLNNSYAQICAGCGVNMDEYRASLPRLQRMAAEQAASHREQLQGQLQSKARQDRQISRAAFNRRMLVLLVVALALAVFICLGSYLYASRFRKTQDEVRDQFIASLVCLEMQEYQCAKEGFQALKAARPAWDVLDGYLNDAQFGLARQYFDSGQWEPAVEELRLLLQRDPGNKPAIDMLRTSYERWITQLRIEGGWFKLWFVTRERDARFPEGTPSPAPPTVTPVPTLAPTEVK